MLSTARWSQIRHVNLSATLPRALRPSYTSSLYVRSRLQPLAHGANKHRVRNSAVLAGPNDAESLQVVTVGTDTADTSQTSSLPGNVFEEFTDDYAQREKPLELALKLECPPYENRPINPVLQRLILRGDMDSACTARKELLEANIPVGRDILFVKAALHSLERRADPTHAKHFLDWWSVVPFDEYPSHIPNIGNVLMEQPTQMQLVLDFSLLCAKAGQQNLVGDLLLQFIFRNLDLQSTLDFIVAFRIQSRGKTKYNRSRLLNSAVRVNLVAGRRAEAMEILKFICDEGKPVEYPTAHAVARNQDDCDQNRHLQPKLVLPKVPSGLVKEKPPAATMASHLKLLRQASKSTYVGNLASFAAYFIFVYEDLFKRTRAIELIRKRIFTDGTLPVQSAWVAAEQLAFSKRKMPLSVLRSFLHYNLPSHVPIERIKELFERGERHMSPSGRKAMLKANSRDELIPVKSKFWPNSASLSAVWKAAIQLTCSRKELDALYAAMLSAWEPRSVKARPPPVSSFEAHAVSSMPVAELPDSVVFHHFITAYATRYGGRHGANVLVDMSRLGVKQSLENWTVLIGVYARSGDVERVNEIFAFLDNSFHSSDDTKSVDSAKFRRNMIAAHNSVIRGYTECASYEEARKIKNRMEELGYFESGVDKRTKAILHRLSRSEKGKFDERQARKNRSHVVDGKRLYIDPKRVDWIH